MNIVEKSDCDRLAHRFALTVVAACLVMLALAQAAQYGNPIMAPAVAISQSSDLTGLISSSVADSSSVTARSTAALVSYVDSVTPFLSSRLQGRAAWAIDYGRLPLPLPGTKSTSESLVVKSCTAWIDSLTGALLRVELWGIEDSARTFRLPSPREAKEYFRRTGGEVLGLPSTPPRFSLLEILAKCRHYPALADCIVAHYVQYSDHKRDRAQVWSIYMIGGPSVPSTSSSPAGSVYLRRWVFDAVNGELISRDYWTLPELRTGD
jgi:hypothetical protein